MYPDEGETITCEYCRRETVASEEMEDWIAVSEVKAEQETLVAFVCSYQCLKVWVKETETTQLSRTTEQCSDADWRLEELLIQHNLIDNVEKHDDLDTCPLCGQNWKNGQHAIIFKGKPIHSHCIDKLERRD